MKNLANCKPSEFLRQTNLIRKSVEKWLKLTDLMNIRQRKASFEGIPEGDHDARVAAVEEQARQNLNDMLCAMLEEHPDETLEVLALVCFVDPKDVDDHTVAEYLDAFTELMSNKSVLNFFISLARLEQTPISVAPRA